MSTPNGKGPQPAEDGSTEDATSEGALRHPLICRHRIHLNLSFSCRDGRWFRLFGPRFL